MIPVSNKDVSRIFGKAYLQELKEKGFEDFNIFKKRDGASIYWLLLGHKKGQRTVIRRIRSLIVLSKIFGVEDKFEQEYDAWIEILKKTDTKTY
jgi:hypothetical protein